MPAVQQRWQDHILRETQCLEMAEKATDPAIKRFHLQLASLHRKAQADAAPSKAA